MNLVRRIERKHKVDAWVGDQERLDRLVRVLEDLVEKGESLALDDDPIELIATATESGAVTLRGDPAEVFAAMDRQALATLELEVSRHYPVAKRDQVRIAFDRKKGVAVESRGESAWIDESHGRLIEELDRGRPRWAWLRGDAGAILVFVLALAEATLLLWNASWVKEGEGSNIVTVLILGPFTAGFVAFWVSSLVGRVLPGFEVVRAGETGQGARALAVTWTLMLAAVGIAASWFLSA